MTEKEKNCYMLDHIFGDHFIILKIPKNFSKNQRYYADFKALAQV